MATVDAIDSHSLEVFIEYKQLTASSLGSFLHALGSVGDTAARSYADMLGARDLNLPMLLVDAADTSNSIKFTFGEGWLPGVSSNEEHDIVVNVPKKLGIPVLCGYLMLSCAEHLLQARNDYLDTRIKAVELQLKEAELQQVLGKKDELLPRLSRKLTASVREIMDNPDFNTFRIYDIDLIAIRRKKDDDGTINDDRHRRRR